MIDFHAFGFGVEGRDDAVAQDVGPISSPDGLRNQLEGGALQGLSRALGEEVTWDDQKVTSVDWNTYKSLYVGSQGVPTIESVLINRAEGEAMGAGETAITIVAAAVGNAIFDATGVRIREAPFTPERVKAALAGGAQLRVVVLRGDRGHDELGAAEVRGGVAEPMRAAPYTVTAAARGRASWTAVSASPALKMTVNGALEYDGMLDYRIEREGLRLG